MYTALLSVLFIGLWPAMYVWHADSSALENMSITPPASQITVGQYLSASGVVIIDAESGQTLYAKYGDVKRPMASITKLMTALIIAENHDVDEFVTVPKGVESVAGNKAYLTVGEQFTVGDMLSALLMASANDAAYTLAIFHSGSESAFAEEMNLRALQLGLHNTSYANAAGFDSEKQYSTPTDIAGLMRFSLQNPVLAERMQQRWDRIYSRQGTDISLSHTHALLRSGSGGVLAGKTGTTTAAKECLVSLVEQDGRTLIVVLLRSSERYADMRTILATLTFPLRLT